MIPTTFQARPAFARRRLHPARISRSPRAGPSRRYEERSPLPLTTRAGRMCSLCAAGTADATDSTGTLNFPVHRGAEAFLVDRRRLALFN